MAAGPARLFGLIGFIEVCVFILYRLFPLRHPRGGGDPEGLAAGEDASFFIPPCKPRGPLDPRLRGDDE